MPELYRLLYSCKSASENYLAFSLNLIVNIIRIVSFRVVKIAVLFSKKSRCCCN